MGLFKRPGEPKPDLLHSQLVPVLVTITVKDGQGKVVAVRNQNLQFVDLEQVTTTAKTYSVLLVDGPGQGDTIAITDPYISDWIVPIAPALDVFTFARDDDPHIIEPTFQTAHYKITRIKIFGQYLLVGSVTERPSDYDLFIALASERAKRAVIQ